MSTPEILVVADDLATAERPALTLEDQGFRARTFLRAETSPSRFGEGPAPLVLVIAGEHAAGVLAWCRDLRRAKPDARLCVVFGRADEAKRIVALETGADVTMVQPFSDRRLIAQLRALDRARGDGALPLRFGSLEVSEAGRTVRVDDRPVDLTTLEFDLLLLLARHRGRTLSRDLINHEIRGRPHDERDRSIDLAVVRLRRKLGDDAHHPRYVKTVRGRGYLLAGGEA